MDSRERKLARAIAPGLVTYPPATATKRFARNMAFVAQLPEPGPDLTPKQRKYLLDVVVRFRRQINPLIVQLARQMQDEDARSTVA